MLIIIWISTLTTLFISYRKDKKRTFQSLSQSLKSLKNLSPGLSGMIATVGFILAVVPENELVRIFNTQGVSGFIFVSFIGAIVTIPGPIAFPMAGTLLQMGAAPAILASFITTLTMVGLVSSPLETSYFGIRFVVMRQTLSFVAAIAIGLIMGVFL